MIAVIFEVMPSDDGRAEYLERAAQHAGVAAPTASQHLKLLVDEGLARVRTQGRHRYYMLADGNVAHALEALLRVADGALPETMRWKAPSMRGLRHARSCYGHLTGVTGVDLCNCFVEKGWVEGDAQAGHRAEWRSAPAIRLRRLVRAPRPFRWPAGGRAAG